MIWWAIEQRRKDREKLVKAARAEALAEERARVRKQLEQVSQETGIPLERLLPEEPADAE